MDNLGNLKIAIALLVWGLLPGIAIPAGTEPNAEVQKNAVASTLKKHCYLWEGTLAIHKAKGETAVYPLSYHLKKDGDAFRGSLDLERSQTSSGAMRFVIPLVFQVDKSGNWVGKVGASEGLRGRSPLNSRGILDKRVVSWSAPGTGFNITLLGETSMDLAIDGLLPLPDNLGEGAVWMSARLQREGFRFVLGPFQIAMMECLGFLATLIFASRFIIQWVASERAKKSVVPEVFWWVSICGAVLMLVYGIYFNRIAIVFGQLTGWTVYSRNLWLIKREKRRERRRLRKLAGQNEDREVKTEGEGS